MKPCPGLLCLVLAAGPCLAADGKDIAVVVGNDAPALERLAGEELCGYVERLFDQRAAVVTEPKEDAAVWLLVGRPTSNRAVRDALAAATLPQLSDQGILLRPAPDAGRQVFVVSGGSPRAVLWAAYALTEWWGVRYLVHGDVLPDRRAAITLPDSQLVMEPNMRVRCWRLVNDLAHGPVSWSLEENQRFLRQLAKMKYNRVFLSFWPCQPFVDYTFRGVRKPPGVLYFGERFPLDDDTVGRARFAGMTEFTNPDLAGATSPEDLAARAHELAHGVLREAVRLGMETGLAIQPFEWPREFVAVLPGSQPAAQLGGLTAGPGNDQTMDDPGLRDMVATIVRAYVEAYPEAEYLHVGMPEHRGWTGQARAAYDALNTRYHIEAAGSYDELCARARSRVNFPGGGQRVETMLKGDLASISFFDSLVRERDLLRRPGGRPDVRLVYSGVVEELFPILARLIPPGGEVLSFVDYTASRQLKQRELLRQRPPSTLPANLIFTLADDNVGILPQLATGSIHELMRELRAHGWSGFYTRYWTVGDLDPTVHYLARASWDATVTPEWAYRDLVEHVCGAESVAPTLKALGIIEEITQGLDEHGLGFGFPVPGMMTKHYDSGGLSDAIRSDHARYREALEALHAARGSTRAAGERFLDFLIGRLTFAVRYLDAAEHFGAVGRAEKAGDADAARLAIHDAYNAIREALLAWVEVAQDHGDLGAVALMNEYCYRPIREKWKALGGE